MTEINKEEFQNHLAQLQKVTKPKLHEVILFELLEGVEVVDYAKRAKEDLKNKLKDPGLNEEQKDQFKREIESFKLNEKHFLIITIEEIINQTKIKNLGICKNSDFVYLFNGAYWKSIDKEEFQKFLGEASEKMGVGKYTAKYFRFRENLFKQFIASEYLPAPQRQKDRVFINLLNGTFEITDKPNLRPFDASDFIKYQLPFAYDPKATAPKFEAFLNRILPEKDKQLVLSEFLGYIFVPQSQLKLEKVLFLFGSGANGKSVIYEIIKALLGSHNTSEFTLQNLTDSNGNSRAQIADKLVNYSSEINGKLQVDMFKKLASGEPIQAKILYKDTFIIEDYAKLIFNTNELPKDVDFMKAFFRRFLIIPFEVTIPENQQNKNLHREIIESELPGVFNWILEGLKRLLIQKQFSESHSIDKALDQFMTESDTVKRFLEEEGYKSDPEKKVLLKELYYRYRDFALDEGNRLLSKQSFRKRLEALKIQVKRESEGMQVFVSQNHFENGNPSF